MIKLWNIISSILNLITSLVQYFIDFLSDLAFFADLMKEVINVVPKLVGWLPAALGSMVITFLTVVVFLRIIGR